ncbi:hypothetical protein [Aeromonas sanarellii]|uniref:hypothetical protein n=1 Tax=Aeromonas sanarellii TaxID=633415 RepID=UPI003A20E5AC
MIDIDSIPIVLPDGSLWMDEGEVLPAPAISETHIYREEVAPLTSPQTYAGSRRGPKPRSYTNTVKQCVVDLASGGRFVARPSLSYCPSWLQDFIIGACRLNGSAGHTGKPLSAGMVFAVMTRLTEISTVTVSELFGHKFGKRYIQMITSAAISACESVKYVAHRLMAHMATVMGRVLPEDAVEQLLGFAFVELGEIARDAEEWQAEKKRLGMPAPAFIPYLVVGGVQYHQRVDGWFDGNGVKLTASMTVAKPAPTIAHPTKYPKDYRHNPTFRDLSERNLRVRIIGDEKCIGGLGYKGWCASHELDPADGFHEVELDTGKVCRQRAISGDET